MYRASVALKEERLFVALMSLYREAFRLTPEQVPVSE